MNVLAVLTPYLFPANRSLLLLFFISYVVRMWATEAISHRYFSHRGFRVSRTVQFALAILSMQNGQRGPLYWAANHRDHHKYSETLRDPHSPIARSYVYAQFNWMWDRRNSDTNLDSVPDFARFAELRWLNRFYAVPYYGGALLLFLVGDLGLFGLEISGASALFWGFFLPAPLTLIVVNLVNSLGHMPHVPGGYRRYNTLDSSVNRPILAVLTLGAGWHNNHHRYAAAARAGFAWWEIDISYLLLRGLNLIGLIHDLKARIPNEILIEGHLRRTEEPLFSPEAGIASDSAHLPCDGDGRRAP